MSVFCIEQEFLEAAEKHFIIFSVLLVGDEGSSYSRLCSPSISISTDTLVQEAPQTSWTLLQNPHADDQRSIVLDYKGTKQVVSSGIKEPLFHC